MFLPLVSAEALKHSWPVTVRAIAWSVVPLELFFNLQALLGLDYAKISESGQRQRAASRLLHESLARQPWCRWICLQGLPANGCGAPDRRSPLALRAVPGGGLSYRRTSAVSFDAGETTIRFPLAWAVKPRSRRKSIAAPLQLLRVVFIPQRLCFLFVARGCLIHYIATTRASLGFACSGKLFLGPEE